MIAGAVFSAVGCSSPSSPPAGAGSAMISSRRHPEPMVPKSSPHLSLRSTTALPQPTSPPAFVAAAGHLVHVIAMDAQNRGAVHLALDRDGAPAFPARALPISLASAGACGDEVIATGVHLTRGVRWAMGLDATGAIRWEVALNLPTGGLVWVLPACIAGESAIVWEVEGTGTAELGVAMVRGGHLERAAISSQPGIAFGLGVASLGSSLFVLRGRGSELPGELLRIDGGAVSARAETAKNAQAIAAVGDHLAVLSWTPGALGLDWLDASLAPAMSSEKLATASPPSWIRHARLHAAGPDRFVVSYLVGAPGDLVHPPGARSEPGATAGQLVARRDATSRALVNVSEVTPAGTAWNAGAWLDDRLFLVHGTLGAALSVFELDRGGAPRAGAPEAP